MFAIKTKCLVNIVECCHFAEIADVVVLYYLLFEERWIVSGISTFMCTQCSRRVQINENLSISWDLFGKMDTSNCKLCASVCQWVSRKSIHLGYCLLKKFAQLKFMISQEEIQNLPLNIGRKIHLVNIRFVLQIYDIQQKKEVLLVDVV